MTSYSLQMDFNICTTYTLLYITAYDIVRARAFVSSQFAMSTERKNEKNQKTKAKSID